MTDTDRSGSEPVPQSGDKKGDPEFIRKARKRFDRCVAAESMLRKLGVEDDKFKNGDQWPEAIRSDRTIEKRPCLTINKVKTFVHQVTNDQRQNRPGINVSPVGDKSDPHTAKMMRGLIRQIERTSNADIAYDTAFDSAATKGWGYWRTITEYESDDSFDQIIKIVRIRNAMRVYMDPDHQQPDGSDAKFAFITDLIPRSEFEALYPKADTMPWDQGAMGDEYKNWNTETHIRIAEYFYFDHKKQNLVLLANGHEGFEDDLAPEVKALCKSDRDVMVRKEREVEVSVIKWCKITCKETLEEQDWLGKWIPIVKVIGDEAEIDGKVNYAGLVRDAKDPQRMYNYWCTAETEQVALMPKAPWLMEEGQIEGHEKRWQQANVKSLPYLLYKGTNIAGKPAPAPQRQQFAGPPAAILAAKEGSAQDMMATTGIRFDSTKQERTYDESGKALRELRKSTDLGSFHYLDNLARSLKFQGRIFIDLIPKIYDTPRVLTILREDDSEEQIKIDPGLPTAHGEEKTPEGKVRKLYNPKLGTYDVAVTIGPSYSTMRAEASDSMLAFMKAVPQSAPLIGDLIAKNMDWPEAEVIATRLASQLPPNLLMKNMKDFPPEAKALIDGLNQKLQQAGQQLQMAAKEVTDQRADRAVDQDKINKDFEAKMAKVFADIVKEEKKNETNVAGLINDLILSVRNLEDKSIDRGLKMQEKQGKEKDSSSLVEAMETQIMELRESMQEMSSRPPKPKLSAAKRVKDKSGNLAELQLVYDNGDTRSVPIH